MDCVEGCQCWWCCQKGSWHPRSGASCPGDVDPHTSLGPCQPHGCRLSPSHIAHGAWKQVHPQRRSRCMFQSKLLMYQCDSLGCPHFLYKRRCVDTLWQCHCWRRLKYRSPVILFARVYAMWFFNRFILVFSLILVVSIQGTNCYNLFSHFYFLNR